jgi:hypothetical protein
MDEAGLERFEAAAGPLLEELGYRRGCPEPSAGALAAAESIRARLQDRGAAAPAR